MSNPRELIEIAVGLPQQKEQLLAEVDELLRTMPSRDVFGSHADDTLPWLGRALAAIQRWNPVYLNRSNQAAENLGSLFMEPVSKGYREIRTLLFQAEADLRLLIGRVGVVVPQGQVFEYFDELGKVIETARSEVLFVDPYLNTDFVSRYLPHVAKGIAVRHWRTSATGSGCWRPAR